MTYVRLNIVKFRLGLIHPFVLVLFLILFSPQLGVWTIVLTVNALVLCRCLQGVSFHDKAIRK